MKRVLLLSALMLVFATGCNPLAKLGANAVKENRKNVEYIGKELNKYLDKDESADKDVVKDKKLAITEAVSLAKKMEAQIKE